MSLDKKKNSCLFLDVYFIQSTYNSLLMGYHKYEGISS
jgi:hypothetical protein